MGSPTVPQPQDPQPSPLQSAPPNLYPYTTLPSRLSWPNPKNSLSDSLINRQCHITDDMAWETDPGSSRVLRACVLTLESRQRVPAMGTLLNFLF